MRRFQSFRLDTANQCLWQGEARVELTPKAFGVLRYLVEHAGRLVTHEELLEALWPATYVNPEVLRNYVLQIRRALGDRPDGPMFIETRPKRGYRFVASVTDDSAEGTLSAEGTKKIVGRELALAELGGCLSRAQRNERQVVFITGESGIGKTTLVDEFQRQARVDAPGVRIARGQCVEGYGGKEAYYSILEALGQLCEGSEGESVVEILATQAPTWLVQFPALVNSKQREMLQREILGATRERMLREIGVALETITSGKPLLLVLEDLHWADLSTVDLISALARRRAPGKLMLIGTYRPVEIVLSDHPLKTLKQDLLVHHLCHEIAVQPLEEAEVAEYLANESGGAAVPEGLAGLIYRHTEGNPLFIVAALDHMCDRGLISLENGIWQMNVPLEKIDLEAPESLRQMIGLQIERLSAEEQRVLEIASVLRGFSLSVTVGAAVAKVEPDTLEELLEGLARRDQIIRHVGFRNYRNGTSPCYEFVHVLYREVLYGRIGPARRRKLHQSLAENGEALHVMRETDVAAELAYQFEQGGDWKRAVKYLRLAAETAGRRFEPRDAALILEHALELVRKIPEAERALSETEILEKLGAIYVAGFDQRAATTHEALVARAAYYGLVDLEVRGFLSMALPMAWVSTKHYLECLDRALQLSVRQDPLARENTRRTYLLWRLGAEWNSQHAEECYEIYQKIRKTGDGLPLPSLVSYSFFHFNCSQYREALRCAVASFAALMKESEENSFLSATYVMYQYIISRIYLFLGEWGNAIREADSGVAIVTKNGNSDLADILRLDRAWIHLHAMDIDGVWKICESVSKTFTYGSERSTRQYYQILAGCANAGRGAYQSALDYFVAVRRDMEQQPLMQDWYSRMPLQWGFTELWLAKGDLTQARLEAQQFLKVTLGTEEHTWRALAFEANARVAIAEGHWDSAQKWIAEALQDMKGFEVPLAEWRVHATASELHRRSKNRDLAVNHRELSRATILKLADSLPAEEPLRRTFLSAPLVRKILGGATALPHEEEA